MQFLLCRSRELSAFISRFLSSLPAEYFAMFSCSFFRYFGSLVLASFSGRDIDQIFAQPQFYNHDYFPAKQQQREAENVNKLVSVLLCCTPHSPLAPFACFSCFFHQYRQLQAAPSSTNSILHNVLLEKRDNAVCDDFQAVSSSRGFFLKLLLLRINDQYIRPSQVAFSFLVESSSTVNLDPIKKTTNKH